MSYTQTYPQRYALTYTVTPRHIHLYRKRLNHIHIHTLRRNPRLTKIQSNTASQACQDTTTWTYREKNEMKTHVTLGYYNLLICANELMFLYSSFVFLRYFWDSTCPAHAEHWQQISVRLGRSHRDALLATPPPPPPTVCLYLQRVYTSGP